jgi:hypothetical protein
MLPPAHDPPNIRYRRLAKHCLDAIQNTIYSETRATFANLAKTWSRHADEYEAKSRPVVAQQQQQLQPTSTDAKEIGGAR